MSNHCAIPEISDCLKFNKNLLIFPLKGGLVLKYIICTFDSNPTCYDHVWIKILHTPTWDEVNQVWEMVLLRQEYIHTIDPVIGPIDVLGKQNISLLYIYEGIQWTDITSYIDLDCLALLYKYILPWETLVKPMGLRWHQ